MQLGHEAPVAPRPHPVINTGDEASRVLFLDLEDDAASVGPLGVVVSSRHPLVVPEPSIRRASETPSSLPPMKACKTVSTASARV